LRFFFFLSGEDEFEFEFELEFELVFDDELELEFAEELELEFEELLELEFDELLPATWKAPSLDAILTGSPTFAGTSDGGVLAATEVPASALMPAAATANFQ